MTDTQDYAHHLKGLSPIGVAAARFAIEKPGLSRPQKDRVAAAIGVLDKMNHMERNVARALVTEAKSEWPDVPPSMPPGTQPDDMERASLYYRFAEEEADRRWNRRARVMTAAGVTLGFLVTWGLLAYTLMRCGTKEAPQVCAYEALFRRNVESALSGDMSAFSGDPSSAGNSKESSIGRVIRA